MPHAVRMAPGIARSSMPWGGGGRDEGLIKADSRYRHGSSPLACILSNDQAPMAIPLRDTVALCFLLLFFFAGVADSSLWPHRVR